MENRQCDKLIKLLIIGDSDVGKSSIMYRFSEDSFTTAYISTIGIDYKIKTIEVNGKLIKLQIWDTAGQERYYTITRNYYRNANGILLVYDITNSNTFNNIYRWLKKIEQEAPEHIVRVLLGNKCDLNSERQVFKKCGEQIAAKHNIPFFETSAKMNTNIEKAFLCVAENVLKNNSIENDQLEINIADLYMTKKKKPVRC